MDAKREEYRRRQRWRAIIAWSVAGLIGAFVVLAIVIGHGPERRTVRIFAAEMSSSQYEQLHKGQDQGMVLTTIGDPGLQEDEVEEVDLLRAFPPRPASSACEFWILSDAPDHLVRLCFGAGGGVLLQKAVRAPNESAVETTLA